MNQKVFKRRVYVAGLLFALLSFIFIIRLFNLHFSTKLDVSDDRKNMTHRGSIRDRNGYILAISIEKNSLFANPEEIKNPEETAQTVASILKIPSDSILSNLKKKKRFIWIKRKIDDPDAEEIRKIGIPGLYLKKEYKRVYPHDELASNIVGFAGVDNKGLEGIEYSFDDTLMGRDDSAEEEMYGAGFGRNITLTIDRLIQYSAEREIEKAVNVNQAKQGAVLVLEVKTGRILAYAKRPSFNPNRYYEYSAFTLRNFSFIDSFEPGSTLKIISLASMLEHHPEMTRNLFTCRGWIDIADVRINCTGVHGTIGMNDIIRHSCNVGIIEAMKIMRKKDLYVTLKKFQFGIKTGVELPGETEGILRNWNKWSGLSKYSMSIGHEISVTSVQLAAAFGAIANGGVYVTPSIIEAVEDRNGAVITKLKPAVKGRVVSRDICSKLMKMMRGVVVNGTGQKAGSAYYCVAGKTGTSQKFIRAKGYSDRVFSSFIGLAPCDDPSVCILIVIDDPADKLSGGQIATPIFASLIDRVLIHQGINNYRLRPNDPVTRTKRRMNFDGKTMPDFVGMRISESLGLLIDMKKRYNIKYSINGSGRVFNQKPAPGASIKGGIEIILFLKE